FTTQNIAPFIENTFRFGENISVTPGLRYEHIRSTISGYKPNAAEDGLIHADASTTRNILLMGVGAQFRTSSSTNVYANWSQAYRPIDYSSLIPLGSIASVDPGLKDSKGYNLDLGFRGSVKNYLNFDVGVFFLRYDDRIGVIETANGPFRTNVADSEHKGIESYIEFSPVKAFAAPGKFNFSFFNSLAALEAKYVSGDFAGKYVEYAPRIINRFGATARLSDISTTFLVSATGESYGDASNAETGSEDAVAGLIPAYTVLDWSLTYRHKGYNLKFGVNNLADKRYFTKRTDEYPGPGIIPSAGRSFYVGVGAKF
ncbi:MAG TPA: TonB-dependent receptor, partial [Chryseosolibacter sp.]